nr:class I SAM-dependent methyltransferase [Oceanococcus sp. HetDA_MAG_MS8]
MRGLIKRGIRRLGYDISAYPRKQRLPSDCDEFTRRLIGRVRPYTLTSNERIIALVDSVRYLVAKDVPGAILECGVWRGGSMLVVAETLLSLGVRDRELVLCDTFTHMPPPGEKDFTGQAPSPAQGYEAALECGAFDYLPFAEVVQLLKSTGYPEDRLRFVQGMVEETLPQNAPNQLALCRLDTDWYESTRHEMVHLYPRLSPGGVLLLDDYGCFPGVRLAVDEYLTKEKPGSYLHRIDECGRLLIKPEN